MITSDFDLMELNKGFYNSGFADGVVFCFLFLSFCFILGWCVFFIFRKK